MQKNAAEIEDPLVGTTIADRYEVKSAIARGGMSQIYHAVQLELGRDVALKVMHGERDAEKASELTRRMLNEAAGAAKLSHPNTIIIHDYGRLDDGRCFIVMELLDGRTLLDDIEEAGPLDPARVVHIALQITGSLAEAHEAGMIHRDLKPSNVMLMRRGADDDFVKVVDFGLVKHDPKDDDVEASGALVGTPRYMAPEQVLAEPVSEATDVYGLGATLYHALTGRPPFDSDSRFVLMAAHMTTAPRAMSEVMEEKGAEAVPPAIEAVVMRCLQKDAADRYQSMAELAEALVEALGEGEPATLRASMPSIHQPVRPLRSRKPKTSSSEIDALADTLGEASDTSSSPMPWIALSIVALLAAGGAVWVAMQGGEETSVAVVEESAPEETTPEETTPPETESAAVESAEETAPETTGTTEGRRASVRVTTFPANATLHHGDADLGNGPLTLEIPAGEEWTLEVRAPGHRTRTITLTGLQREVNVRLQRRRAHGTETPESTTGPTSSDNRNPWENEGSSGSR